MVQTFPLLLMWIVESPADVDCKDRRRVCRKLLDTSDEQLRAIPISDIPWKLKKLYAGDLAQARDYGTATAPLIAFVMLYRAQQRGDRRSKGGTTSYK